jgi:hypothetical protein
MRVDTAAHAQSLVSEAISHMPVIKPQEMKAILYLGIRGEVSVVADRSDGSDHTVDTYA